jgi:methyltransferase OMS1, mitochondrial
MSRIPHLLACLQARPAASTLRPHRLPTRSRPSRISTPLHTSAQSRSLSDPARVSILPSAQKKPTPPQREESQSPDAGPIRDPKYWVWAATAFSVALGIYVVSLGVSLRNMRRENDKWDIPQNSDVSYRWLDKTRDFDGEVDSQETVMLLRAKRRRLINEAYGNVLEVSVGTGRNMDLYDLRPFDPGEDSRMGRSRDRIVTSLTFNDQSEVMVDHAIDKYMAVEKSRRKDERFQGKATFVVGDAGIDGVIDRPEGGFDTVIQTFGVCSMQDAVGFLRKLGTLCRQPGEATTSKLPPEENDGKGGRILLLEHGRSHYDWMNHYVLDGYSKVHALKHGCWFNKDIAQVVEESGLEVERIRRYHFGTTWEIVLRPAQKRQQVAT